MSDRTDRQLLPFEARRRALRGSRDLTTWELGCVADQVRGFATMRALLSPAELRQYVRALERGETFEGDALDALEEARRLLVWIEG